MHGKQEDNIIEKLNIHRQSLHDMWQHQATNSRNTHRIRWIPLWASKMAVYDR